MFHETLSIVTSVHMHVSTSDQLLNVMVDEDKPNDIQSNEISIWSNTQNFVRKNSIDTSSVF
jgi:hypothetical protein